ncbi:hypothetical protein N0V90_006343 [Kalmusia sp. IMI 367209]|nr:hypothetical protein N0V90_006343 [Kalmusia sp. IMI 367209]
MPSKDDKYTDPELRNEVKEEIQAGDKGGEPGQWSARKAQMMASEYKKRGGGYTTDKKDKDEDAKHLDNWTEEEWQTKEGSGKAKQEDGTEKRYLPKKAWEQMSEKEKEETDEKKQEESKEGKQHVGNTAKAKDARKNASKDNYDDANSKGRSDKKNAKDCTQHWEDAAYARNGEKEYKEFKNREHQDEVASEEAQSESGSAHSDDQEKSSPKKRGRGANQKVSNKKQKTGGSSDQPNGAAGDKTRVPRKGQKVQWHALPGYVDGEVVEVVYEQKTVEGKSVKASKEDPRIVLKSSSSGKIAVHKPEAVYFD